MNIIRGTDITSRELGVWVATGWQEYALIRGAIAQHEKKVCSICVLCIDGKFYITYNNTIFTSPEDMVEHMQAKKQHYRSGIDHIIVEGCSLETIVRVFKYMGFRVAVAV